MTKLYRIPGGASRETWSVDLRWIEGERRKRAAGLHHPPRSARRAWSTPTGASSSTSTARSPIRRCRCRGRCGWRPRPSWLERPFFVMERIDGCESQFRRCSTPASRRTATAWRGACTRCSPTSPRLPVDGLPATESSQVPAPDECWRRELDYWERMIDEQRARAAADRARRHPLAAPPSAAAAARASRRARRLPHRQLPLRQGPTSAASSTGRWRTSATRSRTWPGRS